jgi:hypothetical protein
VGGGAADEVGHSLGEQQPTVPVGEQAVVGQPVGGVVGQPAGGVAEQGGAQQEPGAQRDA